MGLLPRVRLNVGVCVCVCCFVLGLEVMLVDFHPLTAAFLDNFFAVWPLRTPQKVGRGDNNRRELL